MLDLSSGIYIKLHFECNKRGKKIRQQLELEIIKQSVKAMHNFNNTEKKYVLFIISPFTNEKPQISRAIPNPISRPLCRPSYPFKSPIR